MKLKQRVKQRILITVGIAIVLIVVFYLITGAISKFTGYSITQVDKEQEFKNCLKEKNIVLYINSEDSKETLKKIEVYDYLPYIKVHNCYQDNKDCVEKDVKFPATWIIDGNKVDRDINLNELSDYSQCRLVK